MAKRKVYRRVSAQKGEKAKLGPYSFANAFGSASAIFIFIYAIIIWFSDFTEEFIVGQYPIPFSFSSWTLLVGLAQTYVFGYIFGWIFAKIYNKSLS